MKTRKRVKYLDGFNIESYLFGSAKKWIQFFAYEEWIRGPRYGGVK